MVMMHGLCGEVSKTLCTLHSLAYFRGHLQTDFSTLNVIMTLRGGLARDVKNKTFYIK